MSVCTAHTLWYTTLLWLGTSRTWVALTDTCASIMHLISSPRPDSTIVRWEQEKQTMSAFRDKGTSFVTSPFFLLLSQPTTTANSWLWRRCRGPMNHYLTAEKILPHAKDGLKTALACSFAAEKAQYRIMQCVCVHSSLSRDSDGRRSSGGRHGGKRRRGEERREEHGKNGVRGPRAFAIWSSFDCSPLNVRGLGAYLLLPTTNNDYTGHRASD